MMGKIFSPVLYVIFLFKFSAAQNNLYNLKDLQLNDLSSFSNPSSNWNIAGVLTSSYTDTALKSGSGTGILLNNFNRSIQYKAGANLFTAFEHGDMYIELDFMMPKGSNSGIYLQSRYEIQLFDSWGIEHPAYSDCGGIYERWDESKPDGKKGYEGHAPLKNAALAPGLWQHLEILFKAPRFESNGKKIQNASFLKVVLNGIVIHENIILSGPTRASAFAEEKATAPLMIQGDHGMVAFRNIRYAPLDDMHVPVTALNYEYYEGDFEKVEQFTVKHLVRKGTAENIDIRLADAKNNYYLKFTGKIKVPVAEKYHVAMRLTGTGKLEIDGKEVIPAAWTWVGGNTLRGDINLAEGEHTFILHCLKNIGWADAGLGLFISKPSSKLVALHTLSSLPERPPVPLIQLQAAKEPELLRSFLYHHDKKLTHCISVGDPSGVHYSYNLKQGALLFVWKGDFLNTTDMWYERGEPQVAQPMGAVIELPGRFSLAADKSNMPDSVNESDLVYQGYFLGKQRYPAFKYKYINAIITDQFLPYENGKGLVRTIKVEQETLPAATTYRLAEGKQITDLGNGLYAINDQSYYLKFEGGTSAKPYVYDTGSKKELLLSAQTNEVKYILYW
jgi:hypothetical protein